MDSTRQMEITEKGEEEEKNKPLGDDGKITQCLFVDLANPLLSKCTDGCLGIGWHLNKLKSGRLLR